ncbi:DUF1553 domain-containing protein [Verrucomicrobia bacterium]|nr:DUF1553 domain-containing protein [Verrucomicrobiota bacterium]
MNVFRPWMGLFLLGSTIMLQAKTDFVRDVRPILSDKCFACHGPDKEALEGGVRLDVRELAIREGKKGTPIVPGDPSASRIITRTHESNREERMPPPEFKVTLSAEEKRILSDWVKEGAEYEAHWAFKRIEKPELPSEVGIGNSIDAYVEKGLREKGFALNKAATKEQLIRRLSFDLTGLPPSLSEVASFVGDTSPDVTERLVDDLLQRESFGERMASEWLDVARYSDTYGYQQDRDRHVWPWRDWVVNAFNGNLPYSEFIRWQVAGDLIPNATDEQILATTFNRLHPQKVEGGSVPEEFRIEYVSDRAQTFATAFLGLTMECSRCHDHKYDPISQEDYFSLSAFFDNIDEAGLYSFFTPSVPTPTLMMPSGKQRGQLTTLSNEVARLETRLAEIPKGEWRPVGPTDLKTGLVGLFDFELNGKKQFTNHLGIAKVIGIGRNTTVTAGHGVALKLTGDDEVKLDVGNFKRSQPFSVSLRMNTPDVKERAVVFHRSRAWTDAASRGYQLLIEEGRLSASLIHFWPGNALRVKTTETLPVGKWHHVVMTYDGSSRARGLKLFVNGKEAEVEVVRDQLTRMITGGGGNEISIGARFRDRGFTGGMVDEMRVYQRRLESGEVASLFDPTREHGVVTESKEFSTTLAALQKAREGRDGMLDQISEIMVMREMPKQRQTHVLNRGAYNAPGQAVTSKPPGSLHSFSKDASANRLDLVEWLLDRKNPLTARVTVNRYWQLLFGQGLVGTSNDFGSQGALPTHPELLNWLAADFMENGWDLKALLRRIVASKTYQQSSYRNDSLVKADPLNKLLGRAPRYRLPAEMIRDNALKVSGLLIHQMGGAPVKPYELAVSFKPLKIDKGKGLYRRSLYTYWKRSAPAPSMMALDASKRDICSVKREVTATPLQAFVFMNDLQFVEAANHLATRMLNESDNDVSALMNLFRVTLGRSPSSKEAKVLQLMFDEQLVYFTGDPNRAIALLKTGETGVKSEQPQVKLAALAVVATALLSHDECVMKP